MKKRWGDVLLVVDPKRLAASNTRTNPRDCENPLMLTLAKLLVAFPAVVLSTEHQAMTRVAVGEAFPTITGVAEARGTKATVVAVPGGLKWMDAMLAGDLQDDFAPRYADKGVNLVALGGSEMGDAEMGDQVKAIDAAKEQLAEKLGKGRGPRVYVLDSAGKVVWFDLEYTLSTHRELHAALDELIAD